MYLSIYYTYNYTFSETIIHLKQNGFLGNLNIDIFYSFRLGTPPPSTLLHSQIFTIK